MSSITDKTIERRYYNADTLRAELSEFEAAYGISTEEFLRLEPESDELDDVPLFERHVWRATAEELQRLESAEQ